MPTSPTAPTRRRRPDRTFGQELAVVLAVAVAAMAVVSIVHALFVAEILTAMAGQP